MCIRDRFCTGIINVVAAFSKKEFPLSALENITIKIKTVGTVRRKIYLIILFFIKIN